MNDNDGNYAARGRLINIIGPILLTLVGSFIVLEAGFRFNYQLIPLEVCAADPVIGNYYCQPYFEYDKPIQIAYRYQPNLHIEGWWNPANPFLGDAGRETRPTDRDDSFWFVLQTDEMGFPNAEPAWRDEYDIVITGDSFTIRTAPQTWIELLGEQTGRSILTLGAPSWTTPNEVEAVKQFGLDKNPDWVVLTYFEGNDIINVQQYLEKQPTGLSWKEYDLQGVSLYRRLIMTHMIEHWLSPSAETTETEPVKYRYPVAVSTEVGEIDAVLKDIHLLPISADYETLQKSDEFIATQEYLLELKELTEANDTRLLVVYIPSKAHVYWSRVWDTEDVNNILERTVTVTLSDGDSGRLEWEPQFLSYDTFNTNHSALEQLFTDFMVDNDFDYLNLTPTFWSETITRGELYHYSDPHWNQAGNQLVADEIQNYIESAER